MTKVSPSWPAVLPVARSSYSTIHWFLFYFYFNYVLPFSRSYYLQAVTKNEILGIWQHWEDLRFDCYVVPNPFSATSFEGINFGCVTESRRKTTPDSWGLVEEASFGPGLDQIQYSLFSLLHLQIFYCSGKLAIWMMLFFLCLAASAS